MNIDLSKIEKTLTELMDKTHQGRLKEAMKYALLSGGKRLRPLLMLEALHAYGVEYANYIDIACSIEMIHAYSLIHDDLPAMDDDDLRRGLPTTHIAFDEATAILAGDALLPDAFSVIIDNPYLNDSQKIQMIKILSEHTGSNGMVYGQMLDLESETKVIDLETLKTIHENKTAKLIQVPVMFASIIADCDNVDTWKQIGYHLGTAFQIQDDVLETTSSEETMGKSLSDERHEKSTYVKFLGLENAIKEITTHFNEVNRLLDTLAIDKSSFSMLIEKIKTRKK